LPPQAIGRLVLDRMPDNFFAETEQVAFMTQNVPPGIDFSNDPLLQGRNVSCSIMVIRSGGTRPALNGQGRIGIRFL
jgi:catalase